MFCTGCGCLGKCFDGRQSRDRNFQIHLVINPITISLCARTVIFSEEDGPLLIAGLGQACQGDEKQNEENGFFHKIAHSVNILQKDYTT